MKKSSSLNRAKELKNDEWYTQISDIEREVFHYKQHFKDKVVFCNCDDPEWSNFWRYFSLSFEFLGLKKLVATHYEEGKPSYKLELVRDVNGDGKINGLDTIKTPLKQNGDFRSDEAIEILKEADIVVSNPPFSLFREYLAQLAEFKKDFLIIGSMNAITYKETFKLIKEDKLWLGINTPKVFEIPFERPNTKTSFIEDGKKFDKLGNVVWFTNLSHNKRNEEIISYKTYEGNEKDYPKYESYDAINVEKVVDIPLNYRGVMGVPISFLSKHNPNQFEIIDCKEPCIDLEVLRETSNFKEYKSRQIMYNGKVCQKKYHRILIKFKNK